MIRLENVFKISLPDVLKTSSKRLEDVWPRRIYWSWPRRLEDLFKSSSEDVRLKRTYSSWSRHLEDFLKTSPEDADERRLQGVFKTSSSRRLFARYMYHIWFHNYRFHVFLWSLGEYWCCTLVFIENICLTYLNNYKVKVIIYLSLWDRSSC